MHNFLIDKRASRSHSKLEKDMADVFVLEDLLDKTLKEVRKNKGENAYIELMSVVYHEKKMSLKKVLSLAERSLSK